MNRRSRSIAGLVVLAGALTTACHSSDVRRSNTYVGSESAGTDVAAEVGDVYLAELLVMESISTDRSTGRLTVRFDLRNTRSTQLPIEWTLLWLDAGGARLDTPRHWTPLVLDGSGFETITRTAPTPKAAGYKLAVRGPSTIE